MKKVLVTGGAGYIGSHTVVSLKDKGFYPVIVDDLRSSSSFILEGLSTMLKDGYAFHCEDVCNVDSMTKIFREHRFDAVIHFAAYKSVGESCEEPLKYYQNNLQGLTNILRLCEEFGVPKFVFSSSCTVYGEPEEKQCMLTKRCLNRIANSSGEYVSFCTQNIASSKSTFNSEGIK